MKFPQRILFKLINFWPPFLGAGIRVKHVSNDFLAIDVEMKLRWWNRNYVGVHFGGSLYAMTDPFYMAMLMENLGRDYIVWDKAAAIRFVKPGRSTVRACFRLTRDQIETIRQEANRNRKTEPVFTVSVIDDQGVLVAEIEKSLYIRRRSEPKSEPIKVWLPRH